MSPGRSQVCSGSSSQRASVPPCQRMSDGLPARWTPPCQGPFTSCGRPLICPMTNDYPVKSQAGGHRVPMYVCVCMRQGFYTLRRGSPFGGGPPARLCSPVRRRRRCLRRQGLIGRGQRGRSDTGHQETSSEHTDALADPRAP